MAKYPVAGHSYIEVDDAAGVPRNLSPYVDEIEPLGRQVSFFDVTGLNDRAQQVIAGVEPSQEFSLYGLFDNIPVVGPDATLPGIVGKIGTVSYGPAGNDTGKRKVTGEFLCLSYQIIGKLDLSMGSRGGGADNPVRFTARFRQSGSVTVTVWQ